MTCRSPARPLSDHNQSRVDMRHRFQLLLCTCAASVVAARAFRGPFPSSCGQKLKQHSLIARPCPLPPRTRTSSKLGRIHTPQIIPRGGASTPPGTSMPMADPSVVFDNAPFLQSTFIFAITNLLGCVLSLIGKTQIHVDLLGTGSFCLAALPALFGKGAALSRVKISAAAVTLWSVKLAGYLLFRIIKLGEDKRLSDLFASASGTISFWVFSLMWGVLCSLPHTLGSTSSSPGASAATIIGAIIYGIGLLVETTADYQKWMFKADNPGKFCNVGLWSISQHPNWFGNLLIWAGILIMNAPALIDAPAAVAVGENASLFDTVWRYRRLALACLSPAFMLFLFNGQADGSLTTTSELAKTKYGSAEYDEYLVSVPKIFPKLF